MQSPVGVDAEAWLRQCVNQAQEVPMDETLKTNYLADLAILSGLAYKSEDDYDHHRGGDHVRIVDSAVFHGKGY